MKGRERGKEQGSEGGTHVNTQVKLQNWILVQDMTVFLRNSESSLPPKLCNCFAS